MGTYREKHLVKFFFAKIESMGILDKVLVIVFPTFMSIFSLVRISVTLNVYIDRTIYEKYLCYIHTCYIL